ncbi:PKD domain-containing protein [Alteromonas macleodii]
MLKYQFTDRGIVVERPASQGSNRGCFSPTIIQTANITGWQAPYDWILYFSTDHVSGSGGTWVVLVSGDPTDSNNWVDYDTAIANGDFDYLPSKPSGNPVYIDTVSAGTQTETPCARVIDGVVYLTTHNNSGPGYDGGDIREQTTSIATSSDGINFTRHDYVLTYDPRFGTGTGHTGYFEWDVNDGKLNYPHTYIGYSTAGDYSALWGTDVVTNRWELLQVWKKDVGRVVENVSGYTNPELVMTLSPSSLVKQDDGSLMALAEIREQGGGGAQLVPRFSIPVLIADDGFTRLSYAGEPAQGGPDAVNQVVLRDTLEYQGRKFKVYRAVGAGTSTTAVGAIGLMEFELVDGSLPLLDPPYPEREDISFIGASSLPANVKRMTGQGSIAFTANGLELTLAAGEREGFYLPDVSTSMKMLDVTWLNARLTTFDYWKPHAGFAKDYIRGSALDVQDVVYTSYETSSDLDRQLTVIQKVGGVESATSYPFDRIGYGGSYTNGESAQAPTSYGLRWMPTEDRVSLLSKDTERGFVDASGMLNGEYVPFIEIENTEAADPITVIIEGIGFGQAGDIQYQWAVDSKPATSNATISEPTAKNFDINIDVAGSYEIGLVTSDEDDSSPRITQSFDVEGPNQPPTANAGPDQSVAAGARVQLNATLSTDPEDGAISQFGWEQVDNGADAVVLEFANTATPEFTAPSSLTAQTLEFRVQAQDSEGATSTDTVIINVAALEENAILSTMETLDFELVTQGNLVAYKGRSNREVMQLKPSSTSGIVTAGGYLDVSNNGIVKVEIIADGKKISNENSDSIKIDGARILARLGDLDIPTSGRDSITPTFMIVLYVGSDTRGLVVASNATTGYKPLSYRVEDAA